MLISGQSIFVVVNVTYTNVLPRVRSPIDGLNLEGIQSVRIYNGTDYTNDKLVIRWTEVFFLQINEMSRRYDIINKSSLILKMM